MSQIAVKGSCLCGAVKYEIMGESKRFHHCHCERCRKATGTGHATNLVVGPQTAVTWLQGEDSLSRYKVPDSERFYNWFCRHCGSSMPRAVPEIDAVIIPAGSLDTEPPVSVQGRIFWDSRAEWSCAGDALPTYAEYPPGV